MDLGCRLRGDVRLRARTERDVESEPVSLQQAARGGDQEHVGQVRHFLVAIQRALRHVRRAAFKVRQDRLATAVLEAKTQETGLADRAAPHLRRLVLERRQLRSRCAERFGASPTEREAAGIMLTSGARGFMSNRNSLSISSTSSGMPSPVLQLVNRNGLLPRISRESLLHHLEAGADVRREVGLVDDEDVRMRDPGPVLARDLVAGGDVDHIDEIVDQRRRKGERQIIAAAFDQHDIAIRKAPLHVLDRREVHAWILAHRSMRAGTCLHSEDAFLEQNALEGTLDVLGVLGRHHVVGDDEHLDAEVEQPRRNGFHDCGLA